MSVSTSSNEHLEDADVTPQPLSARPPRPRPVKRPASPLPWFSRPKPPGEPLDLAFRNNNLVHLYDVSEVPYPLNYGRSHLEQECLSEYLRIQLTRLPNSWLDLQGVQPKRTLDVGCGLGRKLRASWYTRAPSSLPYAVWIVNASILWKKTEFVGFDISPIHLSLDNMDEERRSRINWVQGNFLSTWPFEDKSFDHVRIRNIGYSIPELQIPFFVDEIRRVLTVGGRYEWSEEDPVDDASYPGTPDSSGSSSTTPKASSGTPPPPLPPFIRPQVLDYDPAGGYDDQVLAALFYNLFKERDINLNPTSIIPLHLNAAFNSNIAVDRIRFPIPQGREEGDSHSPARNFVARYYVSGSEVLYPTPISELRAHHKHAVEVVGAAEDAIWEWILDEEGWGPESDWGDWGPLRHPVVAEARRDLSRAFEVLRSRMYEWDAFAADLEDVQFDDDALASAYEDTPADPGNRDTADLHRELFSVLNNHAWDDSAFGVRNGRTLSPKNARQANRSSTTKASTNEASSVSSSSRPVSLNSAASPNSLLDLAPYIPEPESPLPLSEKSGDASPISNVETHQPPPIAPPSVTVVMNGPDAEETIPYASRVMRFFTGVRAAED
ncbi:hypothetical protein DL93DRAFT_1254761 [Clavulina sp. PMI_390]|nr:hypothetical protein DL93DRAFT_1254761 [Clavulina sp. PMI_390]